VLVLLLLLVENRARALLRPLLVHAVIVDSRAIRGIREDDDADRDIMVMERYSMLDE
jgi:hypothetical protein